MKSLIIWRDLDTIEFYLVPDNMIAPMQRYNLQLAHGMIVYPATPEGPANVIMDLLASDWCQYLHSSWEDGTEIYGHFTHVYALGIG